MEGLIVLLVFLVGVPLFFLGLITVTAMLEKRLVWPYVPEAAAAPDSMPELDSYAHVAGSAATEAGFVWLGAFGDGKGKLYKVRYNFFLSPGGDVLAIVGNGTVASVPVRSTGMYSLLADGRSVATVDAAGSAETDLSGTTDCALAAGAGFYALLTAQRRRTASAGAAVRVFGADPLLEYRAFRQGRQERVCALGYASFLDPAQAGWRYTPKGAFLMALRGYFAGLRRSLVPDRIR